MRRATVITIWLLAALSLHANTSDDFRSTALAAISRIAPSVAPESVRLLGEPRLRNPLLDVTIQNSRFDVALDRWELRLNCVPRTSCLPTLAIVESSNRSLFPTVKRISRPAPIVRTGDRRELTNSAGPIRIHQSVVCLQSGWVGDQIRVREENGRKILLAVIGNDGKLALGRKP